MTVSLLGVSTLSSPRLWSRPDERAEHWTFFVGGFAVIVIALLLVVALGDAIPGLETLARVAYDPLLPVVFFLGPPVVSAASAYRHGGLAESTAIGVTPGVLFGVVVLADQLLTGAVTGDAPLWFVVVLFAVVGLVGSFVGYFVGHFALGWMRR